jgi:hypothetical protein
MAAQRATHSQPVHGNCGRMRAISICPSDQKPRSLPSATAASEASGGHSACHRISPASPRQVAQGFRQGGKHFKHRYLSWVG